MGDAKPWSMREKAMCCHLVLFSTFPCLTQPFLCLDGGSWGSYCFGSGVAGLPVLCLHAHSTHDFPFTPLSHDAILPLAVNLSSCAWPSPPPRSSSWSVSYSHAGSWSVHAHTQGLCVGFAHAERKRNHGYRLGFSGAGVISCSKTVCKFPY